MSETKTKSIIIAGVRHDEAEAYLKALQERATEGARKCQLHVLVFDGPPDSAELQGRLKAALLGWRGKIVLQVPPEFYYHKEEKITNQIIKISQYLTENYVPQHINPKENEWIRFLWHDQWLQWSAAATAASIVLVHASMFTTPNHGPWSPILPTEKIINERLKIDYIHNNSLDELIGESEAIQSIKKRIKRYANLNLPVLLVGETGTGKELCARALHELSKRKGKGKFAQHNGALLSQERAESDLFGHLKNAFTGAERDRIGRIEEAINGTFFLDELGHVPREVQSKLLRALNDAEDGRIGVVKMGEKSSNERHLNVRFVGALQNDEDILPDLYYRVASLRLWLPPLRDRPKDIQLISDHFLKTFSQKIDPTGPIKIHRLTLEILEKHPWPGNVRQLKLVLRQAWLEALTNGDDHISPAHVKPFLDQATLSLIAPTEARAPEKRNLPQEINCMVSKAIEDAEKRFPNNQTEAARWLGLETGQKLERWKKRYSNPQEDTP